MDQETKYFFCGAEELDESSLQAIRKEIGESEESKARCLHILKRDLKELKDVLEPCLEDEFLLRFLRVAKFDPTKALQRIKRYYHQQEKLVTICKKCVLPISKVRNQNHLWVSPYRLKDNSSVLIAKAAVNFRNTSIEERLYLDLIVVNAISLNPITQMCGVSIILDYSGFEFRSVLSYSPRIIHLTLDTIQNCLPLRIKACHVVNMPAFFNGLVNFVYPILSQKLKSRVFLHTSKDTWNILHATFPPEVIPEEYGGHLKESSIINALEDAEAFEKQLCEQMKFGHPNSKLLRQSVISNPPIKGNTPKGKSK